MGVWCGRVVVKLDICNYCVVQVIYRFRCFEGKYTRFEGEAKLVPEIVYVRSVHTRGF